MVYRPLDLGPVNSATKFTVTLTRYHATQSADVVVMVTGRFQSRRTWEGITCCVGVEEEDKMFLKKLTFDILS